MKARTLAQVFAEPEEKVIPVGELEKIIWKGPEGYFRIAGYGTRGLYILHPIDEAAFPQL